MIGFINHSTLSSKCSSKEVPSISGINSSILAPWTAFWSLLCLWDCFLADSWFVFPFLVFLGFSSLFDPADWQTKRIRRQISHYIEGGGGGGRVNSIFALLLTASWSAPGPHHPDPCISPLFFSACSAGKNRRGWNWKVSSQTAFLKLTCYSSTTIIHR